MSYNSNICLKPFTISHSQTLAYGLFRPPQFIALVLNHCDVFKWVCNNTMNYIITLRPEKRSFWCRYMRTGIVSMGTKGVLLQVFMRVYVYVWIIYINLYLLIQIEYSSEKKSEIHLCTSRFVGQVLFLGRGERILKNNV